MKRQHDLEDAGDRAQKLRKQGLVRIPLDKIGFWPSNRGGAALSSHHLHEVTWDCVANRTKLQRYEHVDIVEIPSDSLQWVRDVNRERCESDALMPRFSPEMQYVCAGKTHFVHAQKLGKDGGRFLFNEGQVSIRWKATDAEGPQITEQGPLCAIYESSLFHDSAAMHALAADDNLNAAVQWGEDEMQAFGRVHLMMERLAPSQGGQQMTADGLLASLQVSGLGRFSSDDWKQFILLRSSLPTSIALILKTCQFHACAGRVRVRPSDFGLAAKLDPRAPWAKVAMMLWQYMGCMVQNQARSSAVTFSGRKEISAKKLQADVVNELVAETDFVRSVDTFIKSMLKTYATPTCEGKNNATGLPDLLAARGLLLANCGRFLLKVGQVLEQAAKKATAQRLPLTPEVRLRILREESADKFNRAEDYFRKQLVKQNLYAEGDLPVPLYPMNTDAGKAVERPSQETLPSVKEELTAVGPSPGVASCSAMITQNCPVTMIGEAGALTEAHVYSRLCVKGCGEDVMAFVEHGSDTTIKTETVDDSSGLVNVGERPRPNHASSWCIARLVSVSLPEAVVDVGEEGGRRRINVCVDALRAVSKVKETRVILHPSLQAGGKTLDAYDYDVCEPSVTQAIAENMVLWAHLSAQSCVERVTVSSLSDEGKLPFTLQVRAKECFKKGALVLAPAYGEVAPKGRDGQMARSQGVLHDAMLSMLPLRVIAGHADRRRKVDIKEPRISTWEIRSPLLAGKTPKNRDQCLENLAPFWAVLRCAGPRASHNMELDHVVFSDSGFEVKGSKYPKLPSSLQFSVEVPILRNICNIEKGEVLCLPFFDE